MGTTIVNQWLRPSDLVEAGVGWKLLGTDPITGTKVVVRLDNAANGRVLADGIRVARIA